MIEINKIYNGNSLDLLKQLEGNSVDAIVTDPPYELGFMNKKWDSTGIAYNVELWKECLRVLKPGGHLLSFGGTRTYHRMACAIEDAGFEIRDQMQWIYGSGWPKGQDISKGIDKKLPSTDEAKQWNGWNTSLKPANEPICLARKPLSEKTVVANVLKWGTGGLNIDACRVKTNERITNHSRSAEAAISKGKYGNSKAQDTHQTDGQKQGRFPSNVIFDEEAAKILDDQSGTLKSGYMKADHPYGLGNGQNVYGKLTGKTQQDTIGDSGGASRFFYCAKSSRKERGAFNNHPTVKPIKLMEYLVSLVTPTNGLVLDPFAGSGTTLLAAQNKNFNYLGFELDSHYCEIANKRLSIPSSSSKG